jgi:hypothetical protein
VFRSPHGSTCTSSIGETNVNQYTNRASRIVRELRRQLFPDVDSYVSAEGIIRITTAGRDMSLDQAEALSRPPNAGYAGIGGTNNT